MKLLKRLASGISVTALMVGFSACGSRPVGEFDSTQNDTATLWGLTDGTWDSVKENIASWNKSHPMEQFKGDYFANDSYKEKIRTAVGSGNAPTLVLSWGGSPVTDYVKNKSIVDITGELDSIVKHKVFESVAKKGYRNGKLYGVPMSQVQPTTLFYNKSVLKTAGILKIPTTWNDFLVAVTKLKSAGKTPIALAGGSKWPYLMWASYLIDRIGGPSVFNDVLEGRKNAWSNPAVIKAMTMIQDLIKRGGFGDSYQSMTADDKKDSALLATGEAGFDLMGTWVYPDFKTINTDFYKKDLGFTRFPMVQGGRGDATNLTGNLANYWSVSSKSTKKQQKTAIDYLKANTYSNNVVKSLLQNGGVLPVKGIEDKVRDTDDGSGFLMWVYNATKSARYYQLSWDVALPSAQGQKVLENLEQVFLLKITPQQFSTNMNLTLQ